MSLKSRLWTFYRITPEEQKQIEDYQAKHPAFRLLLGKRLGTDHDHASGLIRGRLEWRINKALGLFEKAVTPKGEKTDVNKVAAVFRALADYMLTPPATTVLGGPRYGLIGLAKYKKEMVYGPPEGI